MPNGLPILIALIVTLATWFTLHVWVTWFAFRPKEGRVIGRGLKVAALVPPVAPFVAWKGNHRAIVVAWLVCAVVYPILWIAQ